MKFTPNEPRKSTDAGFEPRTPYRRRNKIIVSLIVIAAIFALLATWGVRVYNKLVAGQEAMQQSVGNVQNAYQRRADLIPNIVAAVKSYAEYEQSTLQAVTEARAKASSTTIDANNMTAGQLEAFQAAQAQMSSALSRLLVTVEKYPDLEASTNYLDLQSKLESCENSISNARMEFNKAAKAYNTLLRRFPNNIIAGLYNFEKIPYFEAITEGAEVAPNVGEMFEN